MRSVGALRPEALAFAQKKQKEQLDMLRNEERREELLAKLESFSRSSVLG